MVSASQNSVLTIEALVKDPENNVVSVDVFYDGIELGWELSKVGRDDVTDGLFFRGDFTIPAWTLDHHRSYGLDLVARDGVGNISSTWPYFTIGSNQGAVPMRQAPGWGVMRAMEIEGVKTRAGVMQSDDPAPVILMAGTPFTNVTSEAGGVVNIAALVTDPDGCGDIASVEWRLFYLDIAIGKDIMTESHWGLYDDAVLYFYSLPISAGIAPSDYMLIILATDKDGNASTEFPKITVVP